MGLLADLRTRALTLVKEATDNFVDSGHSAVYLRQLLRGNSGDRAHVHVEAPEVIVPSTNNAVPGSAVAGAATDTPPVLVIHGYLATRGSLHLLEEHLA